MIEQFSYRSTSPLSTLPQRVFRNMGFLPKSRRWRLMFAGFVISAAGTQLTAIALYPRLQQIGGNTWWFTLLGLAQALPALVVSPIAGGLADRGHRRALMVASDLGEMCFLGITSITGRLPVAIAAAAAASACGSAFYPAEAVSEGDVLASEDLMRANSLRAWVLQGLAIAGPALAGALLLTVNASTLIRLDCLSFAVSAGLVFIALRSTKQSPVRIGKDYKGFFAGIFAAVGIIRRDFELRMLFLASGIVYLLLGMQGPLIYSVVVGQMHGSGTEFGFLMASLGTGMLIASALLHRLRIPESKIVQTMFAALLLNAAALCAFTLSTNHLLSAVAMFFMGIISATFMVLVRVFLQARPSVDVRGRVYGWYAGSMSPISAFALCITLPIASHFAPSMILRVASLFEGVAAICGLLACTAIATLRTTTASEA